MPPGGQHTTMASDAVPVPGTPASPSACVLASVAVTTALTSAASARAAGTQHTRLIVPGVHVDHAPSSAAAHVGVVMPTVATHSTSPSHAKVISSTGAAVRRAAPVD